MNNMSTATRVTFFSAAFVVVVAGLKAAEPLLVPFLLSVFIALICSPLLVWLKSRRVPSGLAILLIVLGVVCLGAIVGAVVGTSIRGFRADLPEYQARLQLMSGGVQQWLAARGVHFPPQFWQENFNPGVAMQLVGNILASFGNVMTNAFLILLTVIFIFAEEVGFREKLLHARGGSAHSLAALESFTGSVNRYLVIKTLLSLATGLLVLLVLWVQGVDYPVMWALLAFLLNFVPTVGSFLAAIPAVLLTLIQLGPAEAGSVALAYVVINLLIGNVVEPRWMGKGLNLSPLVVFLSLVFWGWILGPVGMLLSIPLTILLKIALESDPQTAWVGIMLGSGKVQLRAKQDPEDGA
ncbi:hypothetical protein A9Q89_03890 [Gammaproteobacteria bacterium 53_120_T64]|nr:hypothetical protein A9Q89_03890 [Gammaproteobacteria bacterium 53_120_T64]